MADEQYTPPKYLYQGKLLAQADIEDGAKQSGLDVDTYLKKAGISMVEDSYDYNGKTLKVEDVLDGAKQSNLDFNDYLKKAGMTPTPKKKVGGEDTSRFNFIDRAGNSVVKVEDKTPKNVNPVFDPKNFLHNDIAATGNTIDPTVDPGVALTAYNQTRTKQLAQVQEDLHQNLQNYHQDKNVVQGDMPKPKLNIVKGKEHVDPVVADMHEKIAAAQDYTHKFGQAVHHQASVYAAGKTNNPVDAGRLVRTITGDPSVSKEMDYESKGLPISQAEKFNNEKTGIDAIETGLDDIHAADPTNPQYLQAKADLAKQKAGLLDKYPEYKSQQLANAVAQQIVAKHPNAGRSTLWLDAMQAAKELKLTPEEIKAINFDDIPIRGALSSTIGAAYNALLGIGAGVERIAASPFMDKDKLSHSIEEGLKPAERRFEDIRGLQAGSTIVDTDKNSPTYLQNIPNPNKGKYNYTFATMSNAIAHGVGSLFGGFVLPAKALGGIAKLANPALTEAAAADYGLKATMVLGGYENNYQEAQKIIGSGPGDEGKRHLMALLKGVVDYEVFKPLNKLLSPQETEELGGIIKDGASRGKLIDWTTKVLTKAKDVVGHTAEETAKIGAAQIAGEHAKNIVDHLMGDATESDKQLGEKIAGGLQSLPFSIAIPLGLGQLIKFPQHSRMTQENLYNAGLQPETYKAELPKLVEDGTLTPQQAEAKGQVIDAAAKAVNSIPDDVELNHAQKVKYTESKLKEEALKLKTEGVDDKAVTNHYNEKIKAETAVREAILAGKVEEEVKPEEVVKPVEEDTASKIQKLNERDNKSIESVDPNAESTKGQSARVGQPFNQGLKVSVVDTKADDKYDGREDAYEVISKVRKPAEFGADGKMTKAAEIEVTLFNTKEEADTFIQKQYEKVKSSAGKKQAQIMAEANKSEAKPIAKAPEPSKPISEMTADEISDHAKSIKQFQKDQENEFFGEEGAKKYREAQSVADGAMTPSDKRKEAYKLIDDMEKGLTPEQSKAFFSGGGYDPAELRHIASTVSGIEGAEDLKDLSQSLKLPLLDFSKNPKNEGNQAAINAAKRKAVELGIDPKELVETSIKNIAADLPDNNDAKFLANEVFKKLSIEPVDESKLIPDKVQEKFKSIPADNNFSVLKSQGKIWMRDNKTGEIADHGEAPEVGALPDAANKEVIAAKDAENKPADVELNKAEKAVAKRKISKAAAKKIVESEITPEIIEENKELFDGFPFSPADKEAVNDLLKSENENRPSNTEPGGSEPTRTGVAENKEPGNQSEKDKSGQAEDAVEPSAETAKAGEASEASGEDLGKVAFARSNSFRTFSELHPDISNDAYNELRASKVDIPAKDLGKLSKKYAEEQKAIRAEMDKKDEKIIIEKAGSGFTNLLKKLFTSNKGLNDKWVELADYAKGDRMFASRNMRRQIFELKKAVTAEKFTDTQQISNALSDLTSQDFATLPASIQDVVRNMRAMVDGYSQSLVNNGLVSPGQAITIADNIGEYLNRAYKLHTVKGYKPEPAVLDAAVNFVAQQELAKINADPANVNMTLQEKTAKAVALAKQYTTDMLTVKEVKGQRFTEQYSKDLSTLTQRKDIPEPIRKLMGEYVDPVTQFAITISKLATLESQGKLLNALKDNFKGSLFFEKDEVRPEGFNHEVASYDSQSWNPLGGLYTNKLVIDALQESADTFNVVARMYRKAFGYVKLAKTVYSIPTQSVNFFANPMVSIANGHFKISEVGSSWKYYKDSMFGGERTMDSMIETLVKKNVIGQSVDLRMIRDMLGKEKADEFALDQFINKPQSNWNPKTWLKTADKIAQKQYAASDSFWKTYGFMNEAGSWAKAKFDKEYKNLTPAEKDEVDNIAAERIKNTYPTYDRAYEGLLWVGKHVPFIGNFMAFQAEVLRTVKNNISYAITDIRSTDPKVKALGAKRMAGIVSYAALKTGINYFAVAVTGTAVSSMWASAFGSNDEKSKRKNLDKAMPGFLETHNLAVTNKGDGVYSVVDLDRLDPYNQLWQVTNALTVGSDGGIARASQELIAPFVELDMITNAVRDIDKNESNYGYQIYNEADDVWHQTFDKLAYVYGIIEPTSFKYVKRVGESDKPVQEAILSLLGARSYEVNTEKVFSAKLKEAEGAITSNANFYYFETHGKEGESRVNKERYKENLKVIATRLNDLYTSYISLGANPENLDKIISKKFRVKGAGMIKKMIKTGNITDEDLESIF